MNKLAKMKHKTPLGSRIAEVHNGSSLFTGDAGQGESNIRRWIIENDWLEAIIALPLNMFYNTGIATYIWVLTNRKPKLRKGKVQLIDATEWFKPLRKNLGKKNCEFSAGDIQHITDQFQGFKETPQSKVLANEGIRVLEDHRGTTVAPGHARYPGETRRFQEDGRQGPSPVRRVAHGNCRRDASAPRFQRRPAALRGGAEEDGPQSAGGWTSRPSMPRSLPRTNPPNP